jgi:flagellar assembly protein FliH
VRMSPADYAALTADGTERAEGAPRDAAGRAVTLVVDETLQPGDAVATSGATVIDARIATGLERVRAVLSR